MAEKQTKPVEQPPREEEEHVSTEAEEEEETATEKVASVSKLKKEKKEKKEKQEELVKTPTMEGEESKGVKTPSLSPTVSAAGKQSSGSDFVSETATEKIASHSKLKKQKKEKKENKQKKEKKEKKKKKEKKEKKKEVHSSAAAVASPKKKRSIEEGSSRDVNEKRLNTEKKKKLFERVWSEQDEIVLLQAIIDLGTESFKDLISFEESVKSLISIEFNNTQLKKKIRRMKYKYQNKVKKEVVTFLTPHDRTCFEMSKEIWGFKVEEEEEEEDRKSVVLYNGEDDWFDNSFLVGKVAGVGVEEEWVKQGWN